MRRKTFDDIGDISLLLRETKLEDSKDKKTSELLVSLLTGSINDIDKVKEDIPTHVLDKVKQKILLFDGEQTRFIYQKQNSKNITIQGNKKIVMMNIRVC